MPLKLKFRKILDEFSRNLLNYRSQKPVFRFDGVSFKTEPSSKFPHFFVFSLGSYRQSPFVTGNDYYWTEGTGLKTEILDYDGREWMPAADYPFSNSDR